MARTDSYQRRKTQITAVIDSWPYTAQEIERAVYSAGNVAQRVVVVLPDVISPYDAADFPGVPAEFVRLPFWGNFATLRNDVMQQISTPWAFLLCGNEAFLAADTGLFLSALDPDYITSFRVIVATGERGQVLAQPIRVVPATPNIRYAGRIWPLVQGSLIEFGHPVESLEAHLYRLEDRSSTARATALLRSELEKLATPGNWKAQLALAVVAWAEHRYSEARNRLDALPRELPDEAGWMVDGIQALLWLEQGHADKAVKRAQGVLAQHPERADLWSIAGDALTVLELPAEAAEAFDRAARLPEFSLPYMEPGYASYAARLKLAQAEIATRKLPQGLARVLDIIEDYPGYRAAWQEVLRHLRTMPPDQVFSAMNVVVAPSKIRQFFERLTHPTEDERRMQKWLRTTQD